MEETINKFVKELSEILDELYEDLKMLTKFGGNDIDGWTKRELELNIQYINILINFLKYPDSLKTREKPYLNYYFLSYHLTECSLTNREKIDCLMYVIKRNNLVFKANKVNIILDLNKFAEKYNISHLNPDIIERKLDNINFEYIIKASDNELSKRNLEIKRIALEVIAETEKEDNLFVRLNQCAQKSYFDKLDSYTSKDIRKLDIALKHLNVTDKMRAIVMKFLNKNLKERNIASDNANKENKPRQFNYDDALRELKAVIDFDNMMPKKFLNMEEEIYYLSLLTKININREKRRLFLRNCEDLRYLENPIVRYKDNYVKFKYYEEKVAIQEQLSSMEVCSGEMMICSTKDYYLWKDVLYAELKQTERWIPKNFEFEEMEAQRLLKNSRN